MIEQSSLLCYNMTLIRSDTMSSIYNEKRFLNGDIEALEAIYELRKEHLDNINRNAEIYSKAISIYDTFLDEIIDELLKFNLSNSLEYSLALNYLIDKGYFSESNSFKHKETFEEVEGKLGMSIVTGKGCCRNISAFHKDVFDKLDLYSKLFYCYEGMTSGVNSYANHVINLVEYKDNLYGVDLHNNCVLFHFKKPMVMELVSLLNSGKLRYKPYYELVTGESDIEDIKDTIELFKGYSKVKPISPLEYNHDIVNSTKDLLESNKNRLDNFSEKTKILKKNLVNNMPHID